MRPARCSVSLAFWPLFLAVLAIGSAQGCGARSQILVPDAASHDAGIDVAGALDAADLRDVTDVRDVTDAADACVPVPDGCGPVEICGNGQDDNCSGGIDENCPCEPGTVQSCFNGPPGRRNVGACRDGTQTCEMIGRWGACRGGIGPREDVCNGQDNLCNGCSQQRDCPINCPSPGDARVRDGAPFRPYVLRGGDFYPPSLARAWRWQVRGGPCDEATRRPSFELTGASSETATFVPRLSGDYTVTLTVISTSGMTLSCTWIVHIEGPGLRVEMCYPESETQDLDLYLHEPNDTSDWFPRGGSTFQPYLTSCGWHNCEATIRGRDMAGNPVPRANWGYAPSPLSECENGPQGDQWRRLGFCANPRLDIDNNLSEGTGLPENINVDHPREGERFRIMVQNFTGRLAHPIVNVYCSGRRVATYGAPPDEVRRFEGAAGGMPVGAMWRVADVTTHVDAMGRTSCDVVQVHPPGASSGYDVTYNDPRY